MLFADFDTIEGALIGKPFERELKIIMSSQTDAHIKNFTLILSTLAPDGGCTDFHSHDEGGELMIFMSGQGKAWLEGKEYELKPGVALYAPPGMVHKTLNTGKDPLRIACVFIPAISTEYITANISAAKKAADSAK
jgi:mannose-6-phosphate isomerase-like protein (cupin superfamily)